MACFWTNLNGVSEDCASVQPAGTVVAIIQPSLDGGFKALEDFLTWNGPVLWTPVTPPAPAAPITYDFNAIGSAGDLGPIFVEYVYGQTETEAEKIGWVSGKLASTSDISGANSGSLNGEFRVQFGSTSQDRTFAFLRQVPDYSNRRGVIWNAVNQVTIVCATHVDPENRYRSGTSDNSTAASPVGEFGVSLNVVGTSAIMSQDYDFSAAPTAISLAGPASGFSYSFVYDEFKAIVSNFPYKTAFVRDIEYWDGWFDDPEHNYLISVPQKGSGVSISDRTIEIVDDRSDGYFTGVFSTENGTDYAQDMLEFIFPPGNNSLLVGDFYDESNVLIGRIAIYSSNNGGGM